MFSVFTQFDCFFTQCVSSLCEAVNMTVCVCVVGVGGVVHLSINEKGPDHLVLMPDRSLSGSVLRRQQEQAA